MNDLIPSARVDGRIVYHGEDLYDADDRPRAGAQAHRHGVPEAEPVPEVDLRQHRLRPARDGHEGRHGRDRRERAAARRAVGRGQGPAQDERVRHVRRPAAAPLHRARARHRARRAADGRALLGARPDLDRPDRGPDDRAQAGLLDRHRHPQHAAGRARVGHDGVLHRRARRRRQAPHRRGRRVRRRPTRSSRTRTTSAPRTTSPGSSASADGRRRTAAPLPGGARSGSRSQALGALDLVVSDARPHARGAAPPGHRARGDRDRRRRPDRRPLPRGPPGDPLAARAAGAGGVATCASWRRCCT